MDFPRVSTADDRSLAGAKLGGLSWGRRGLFYRGLLLGDPRGPVHLRHLQPVGSGPPHDVFLTTGESGDLYRAGHGK